MKLMSTAILAPTLGSISNISDYAGEFNIVLPPRVYEETTVVSRKGILHVSHSCRPYGNVTEESVKRYLSSYIDMMRQLGMSQILVHGPFSFGELANSEIAARVITSVIPKDITMHVELPAFDSQTMRLLEKLENRAELISTIIAEFMKPLPDSVKLVLDTAHLWANGLTPAEMIPVFKEWESRMVYCHMNGNIKPKFCMDTHCPIFTDRNQMGDVDELMKYLASTNLVLIAEVSKSKSTVSETVGAWKEFGEKYGIEMSDQWDNPDAML